MNILALDLGTHCGYCVNKGAVVAAGCWDLATAKEIATLRPERLDRRGDFRLQRFFRLLSETKSLYSVEGVAFEDVQFASTTQQAHLWATWRAAVWLTFPTDRFRVDCVPVATLKKFATGSGKADKDAMKSALVYRANFGIDVDHGNDNTVDACWTWLWATETFKGKA